MDLKQAFRENIDGEHSVGQRDDLVFSIVSVSKRYPGVQALSDVTFDLLKGEVHGLVGGNGAGKSTLIKIATRAETPDEGTVRMFGGLPRERGITAIYQELTTVPEMTAMSNVFLGTPIHRGGMLSRRAMEQQFRSLATRFQSHIQPMVRAGSLSVADQQLLEIMRALVARCRVIVMDEPTASLGARERSNLYKIVADLKQQGSSIIYIGHDLDEVMRLSDRISVMRNGCLVATGATSEWTHKTLVDAMLDGGVARSHVEVPRYVPTTRALEIENLELRPGIRWSFHLGRGEILGVAGLVGSGRTSLLHALAGLRPDIRGTMKIFGRQCPIPHSVRAAIRCGVVLTPEDRKRRGLVLALNGYANLSLPNLKDMSSAGISRLRRQRAVAATQAQQMDFAPKRLAAKVGTLSGGNQQKLAIAKWLPSRPAVLLLDEPTRGIDVGAKAEIYRTIRTLCAQGMSVIVVSSELAELSENCDRVMMISAGRQIGELLHAQASVERMMKSIFEAEASSAQGALQ